jgi:hypothetical protein
MARQGDGNVQENQEPKSIVLLRRKMERRGDGFVINTLLKACGHGIHTVFLCAISQPMHPNPYQISKRPTRHLLPKVAHEVSDLAKYPFTAAFSCRKLGHSLT